MIVLFVANIRKIRHDDSQKLAEIEEKTARDSVLDAFFVHFGPVEASSSPHWGLVGDPL